MKQVTIALAYSCHCHNWFTFGNCVCSRL